tara:strand:+ start:40560 stop:40745 length:186 start_codon:yes stop_codon:yes gene_type:complete
MEYVKITGSIFKQLYGIFNGISGILGKIGGEQYTLHSILYVHLGAKLYLRPKMKYDIGQFE